MGRFLGGRFGNIASISPGVDAESGIYSMPDQYYSRREGGWKRIDGLHATGGVISDYESGGKKYRAHVFASTGCLLYTSPSPRDS